MLCLSVAVLHGYHHRYKKWIVLQGSCSIVHRDTAGCTMECTGYWNGGGEDQYSEDGGGLQQKYSHPQVLRWPPAVGPSTPGRSFLLPVTFIK